MDFSAVLRVGTCRLRFVWTDYEEKWASVWGKRTRFRVP